MIKPLHDNIVLKRDQVEKKTASGIILSGETKEQPMFATVLAVGPGKMGDHGFEPTGLKTGDRVVYKKYAATEIKLDNEEFLLIAEKDVLGIIE